MPQTLAAARTYLVAVWFGFLLANIAVVFYLYFDGWIERDNFNAALTALNSLYAPYVSAITVFYWASGRTRERLARKPHMSFVLALSASVLWNAMLGAFFGALLLFRTGSIEDTIDNITQIGTLFSWLVGGAIGYYFATPNAATAGAERTAPPSPTRS